MSVSRYQYEQEINEELILKVYRQLHPELLKVFPLIQTHTLAQIEDYVNSFIESEKYKYALPECFGTFKAYLGDVPGNVILNYEKPKFHDEVEAEKRALEMAKKWRLENEEFYKNRCRCCGRAFNSYENL